MNIVPVFESDWESLKNIRLESLLDSPDAFGLTYQEAREISDDKWKSIASEGNGLKFLLARCNGECVGLVGGVYTHGQYELVSMWVKPEKRNGGIGVGLAKELLSHAKSQGFSSVVLNVSVKNKAAYSLYSKIGFRALEEGRGSSGGELKKMVWHSASEP
ncbi:GNAT family N-acetyltransferase [Microbulbifer sp. YPW1]|uniref:GNAT family N-acetyltransferase n=1 Tax=Microbulbifer sp. YPW1 TaxID=2745199 RepID=UPI001599AAA5|nr:GNAT family N-acetyltransferase [Microbulbifer sp. YPW1]QKX16502.1 GNAT family N-acetyltransferase [Microbulbifer sp. YPW1]